jgi:putative ABC transport system permease protein
MKDTLTCALRELIRRKNRTAANTLGYALAVALMIILAGGLLNSKRNADDILSNTGTHFVAFVPACMGGCLLRDQMKSLQESEGFVANGIPTNLISKDFIEEVRKLPTVKDAAPFLLFQFKNPNDSLLMTLGGFDPRDTVAVGTNCCAASDMVDGRFLTSRDTAGVMVEEAYARLKRFKVKDSVDVGGEAFTAIGIVNSGIRPMKANLYMVFQSAEKVINKRIKKTILKNQANVMLVEAENANVHDSAVRSIKELFPSLVFSSYNCYKPASKVMGLNAIAAWSLIAAGAVATLVLSLRSQFS